MSNGQEKELTADEAVIIAGAIFGRDKKIERVIKLPTYKPTFDFADVGGTRTIEIESCWYKPNADELETTHIGYDDVTKSLVYYPFKQVQTLEWSNVLKKATDRARIKALETEVAKLKQEIELMKYTLAIGSITHKTTINDDL